MKMSTVNKAVLAALLTAALIGGVRDAALRNRINDLEGQRIIYAARLENWQDRAIKDEEVIDQLQTAANENVLPDGLTKEYAGKFLCTAYCTEEYPHICGTGNGITASGAPVTPGLTVAADESLPFGTVLYIEGVGVRVVQDRGAAIQDNKLDVAVSGNHEDALNWEGYGEHTVWILRKSNENRTD